MIRVRSDLLRSHLPVSYTHLDVYKRQEYIRLIDAYTHVQTHGEVCPANWEEGKDAMKADRTSTADYLSKH